MDCVVVQRPDKLDKWAPTLEPSARGRHGWVILLSAGEDNHMGQEICVHATGKMESVRTILSDLPEAILARLPPVGGIRVVQLDQDGPEYRAVFSGQTSRARTSSRGDVYIDMKRIHGESSLRALLLHELSHAIQFTLGVPLRFRTWKWLHDLEFWDDRTRSLVQLVAEKAGVKDTIRMDLVQVRPAAQRLMNLFSDADAHAFLLDEGLLDMAEYGEAVRDYLADLRQTVERQVSEPLDRFWLTCQRRGTSRTGRIASQSWPVFMEWLTIVGGRWARVGTLIERADAATVLDEYVAADREALRTHLGDFADDRVFSVRWQELAAAGEDLGSLWKVFQRLASDAVVLVRSVCDR